MQFFDFGVIIFFIIIIIIFFSKPAISLPEQASALIFFTKRLHSRWRCARTPSDRFSHAVNSYGRSWGSSRADTKRRSLETSRSSTRACSVSYNYAWEYFRRERKPSTLYHVMRAALYQRKMTFWRQPFYQVGVATVVIIYFTSQHRTMTLYDSPRHASRKT